MYCHLRAHLGMGQDAWTNIFYIIYCNSMIEWHTLKIVRTCCIIAYRRLKIDQESISIGRCF